MLAHRPQAQRPRIADQLAEHPAASRRRTDLAHRLLVQPDVLEPLEARLVAVEDAERGIAGAGQVAGSVEHVAEHRLELELGDELAPDLEQSLQLGSVEARGAHGHSAPSLDD